VQKCWKRPDFIIISTGRNEKMPAIPVVYAVRPNLFYGFIRASTAPPTCLRSASVGEHSGNPLRCDVLLKKPMRLATGGNGTAS
jgi:hypothetical protein